MTSKPTPQRRAAIARLVQAGIVKHENPGQYYPDTLPEEARVGVPAYDVKALQHAFPHVVQLDFDDERDPDTGETRGIYALIRDGEGPDVRVALGVQLPPDTTTLIELIHAHFRGELDLANMKATEDAFAGLDD